MRRVKTCGVYKITNTITDEFYVGSSVEIQDRWNAHKWCAKRYVDDGGKWRRSHFYRAMQKFGTENFTLEVIEECPFDILREREQYYLDTLRPAYNVSPIAIGGGGQWTQERKADYSIRRKAEVANGVNVPPDNYMRGNTDFRHSEASKQKIQKSVAKAVERAIKERGSYVTLEGLASRRAKQEQWLTPERRQQFVEDTKEAINAAHEVFQRNTEQFTKSFAPLILDLQDAGLNFKEIAKRLTDQGHKARHGGSWTDQAVADLLTRVGRSPDRPRGLPAELARKKNSDVFAQKMFPIIDEWRTAGLNLSEIAIKLNEAGYLSRRGVAWTYQSVREVMKRIRDKPKLLVPDDVTEARYVGWDRRR